MKKLTNYQKQCIRDNNDVREINNIETITVKIRKCNMCGNDFESSCYYTCSKCRRKKERMIESTDIQSLTYSD